VSAQSRALESPDKPTRLNGAGGWITAVAETARPRQWPKNLLVFAAPLAGASLGRQDGLGYALGASVAFVAAFVTSGFVLRALGGAVATAVPPSAWFLLTCSLGALMVTIAKRFAELSALGGDAAAHRPVMRWYTAAGLRRGQRLAAIVMLAAYLIWAAGQSDAWMRAWHLVSALPLAAAVVRFDWLTGRAGTRPVEDLIARDRVMAGLELGWLLTFTAGL